MLHQDATCHEPLATVNALVRPLACVDATVCFQIIFRLEALATITARKGTFSSVCPQVTLEVGGICCRIAALRAHVLLPSCLGFLSR